MKSINYFDSSYSPNEACEATDIPNCSNCADEGFTRWGVFNEHKTVCECSPSIPCYFCQTPMELETNPYRDDVCYDCALSEYGH